MASLTGNVDVAMRIELRYHLADRTASDQRKNQLTGFWGVISCRMYGWREQPQQNQKAQTSDDMLLALSHSVWQSSHAVPSGLKRTNDVPSGASSCR